MSSEADSNNYDNKMNKLEKFSKESIHGMTDVRRTCESADHASERTVIACDVNV